MDRRSFLKAFSLGMLGTALADRWPPLAAPWGQGGATPGGAGTPVSAAGGNGSLLSIVTGGDPATATAKVLDGLGGLGRFVSKGDVVLVKPNMAWDRTPEQAANTNPEVVGALVRLAYEQGAKKVKVFDNTCNTAQRCYERSGIAEAARQAGADVSFVEDRHFKKVLLGGESLEEWPVHREALEVDKIINVPVAKHHTLARLTLSMKNHMGLVGGRRSQLHQRIDVNVVDLTAFFKPQLTVLDATRVLTANGPQGGRMSDVRQLDTLVASTDWVAIDAYGATLFGMKGEDLGCVREAHERGLGEMDLEKVSTVTEVL